MKTDQKIHPVYFIYGTEELLMEEEIQSLLDRTLGPKEKALNYHVFSGEEHTPQEIVEAAQTLPMFAKHRFVLVKEAEKIDPESLEVFRRYLENPFRHPRSAGPDGSGKSSPASRRWGKW
jgi:DNA polymerase-3 subunit delta